MERENFIKLTSGLYKVTELFPEKEPLVFFIKEKAIAILADSILLSACNPIALTKEQKEKVFEGIMGNIEILKGYFELAKSQKWVNEANFLVLEREYEKIKKELKEESLKDELLNNELLKDESFKKETPTKVQEKKPSPVLLMGSPQIRNGPLKKRHRKILEVLKVKATAQVRDLEEVFPGVTKRTLRRDFRYLLSQGLVKRMGDGNTTLYKLTPTP